MVAALTDEKATAKAQAWFAARADETLTSSLWLVTETHSALAIKVRAGSILQAKCEAALATFADVVAGLNLAPISSRHFHIAARLCSRSDLKIRASDALHLAVCAEAGSTLVTLDHEMADAARTLGTPVETP